MRLKGQIKRVAGALCASSLARPLIRSRLWNSVNVVYYHSVGKPAPHYAAFYGGCTLNRFVRDLEQLGRVFDFGSLDEVMGAGPNPRHGRRPRIALTFDDGFDLRQAGVTEVLTRLGVPATTFVITSCIGNQKLMWRHCLSAIGALVDGAKCVSAYNSVTTGQGLRPISRSDELMSAAGKWPMASKDALAAEIWERCGLPPVADYLAGHQPYFSWDGLRDWQAAGHSVGFHTHSHPYCSRLKRDDLEAELLGPARELRQQLGLKQLCMSYPFGERLPQELEDEVFATGDFAAMFGIAGFRVRGTSKQRLERAGVEQDGVGWPVFACPLLGGIVNRGGGNNSANTK